MARIANGWNRGTVDAQGFVDYNEPEAWQRWAENVADAMPEAALLQLLALSERGWFDGMEVETDGE